MSYTRIMLGRLELEQVKNIVREIKMLWQYLDNVWPNGDRKQLPDIKVTRDNAGQYYAHMNERALTYMLLYCRNLPKIELPQKDAVTMPPDFLGR